MRVLINKKIVQMAGIRAVAVVAGLWLQIWLVNEFGATAYGEYIFFATFCSLVIIVSKGGLDTVVLKSAAIAMNSSGGGASIERIRLQYLWLGLIFTSVSCLVLWLVYALLPERYMGFWVLLDWRLIYGASVGAVLFQILVGFARGVERPAVADAFDSVVRNGLMAAVAMVLVASHYINAPAIIVSYVLSFYLGSLLLYRLTKVAVLSQVELVEFSAGPRYGPKAHLSFMLAGLLSYIFFQMDTLILGSYIDSVELGAYNMACNLVRAVIFIPMILIVLVQPQVAVAFEKSDIRLVIKIAVRTIGVSFVAAIACSVLLCFLGELILTWINPVFVVAKYPMMILAVAHIVNSILIITAGIVSMTSRYMDIVRAQLMGGVVALSLYVGLIPDYGQIGAALSMFAGLLVVLGCYVFMYRKYIPEMYGLLLRQAE
jgi:O-antigen/teichoic acid export membrane protein